MKDIVYGAIQDYLFKLDRSSKDLDDPVLRQMEELGDRLGFPIIGPLVGRLLFVITKSSGAKSVFELGSGFGYSTYWFASALPKDGVVHHTDMGEENIEQAKKYMRLGKLSGKVRFHQGDALKSLDETGGTYDILYGDINKYQYPLVYPRAKKHVKVGGLLIMDNMLWSGRVVRKAEDRDTLGIQKLTDLLVNDSDFFTSLLPLRDGVSISYRLK